MAHDRIETDPEVMLDKPVVRGTRITVQSILRELGAGMTVAEIIADHPHVSEDDIRAARAFAAGDIRDEEIVHG